MKKRKGYYTLRKAEVREEAIQWQDDFSRNNYSYFVIFQRQKYFEKLGRRYGLLREFKENAII